MVQTAHDGAATGRDTGAAPAGDAGKQRWKRTRHRAIAERRKSPTGDRGRELPHSERDKKSAGTGQGSFGDEKLLLVT